MARRSKDDEVARNRNPGDRSLQSRHRHSIHSSLAHLQTAIVSYRRQADMSGDLDPAIRQFLDRVSEKETRESVMAKLAAFDRSQVELKAGYHPVPGMERNHATGHRR